MDVVTLSTHSLMHRITGSSGRGTCLEDLLEAVADITVENILCSNAFGDILLD